MQSFQWMGLPFHYERLRTRIHADRDACGDRNHRIVDRLDYACFQDGQIRVVQRKLPEQSSPKFHRMAVLSNCEQRRLADVRISTSGDSTGN